MNAEEIRTEAIERIARATYERRNPNRRSVFEGPPWDECEYREHFRNIAANAVDALGDLLPTATEEGSWSDQAPQHRFVTDWRAVE